MGEAKSVKLYLIHEEPPLNEHGLPIPPAPVDCIGELCVKYSNGLCAGAGDKHHLLWEKDLYPRGIYANLRNLPELIVRRCRIFHDLLHKFQAPPPKPSIEAAKLAIQQSALEKKIRDKYLAIADKNASLESGGARHTRKILGEIDRLEDYIDTLKEQRVRLFGSDSILPTQYWIVEEGKAEPRFVPIADYDAAAEQPQALGAHDGPL